MASPVKRLTTTRSVVDASAANRKHGTATRLASTTIKAIPGRKAIRDRLPFLSCRSAVIVDNDNIRVGGHRTQPRAVQVGIRLRRRPRFRYQGFFHDFSLTPCSGDARRADVLDCARFLATRPAGAIASAATPAQRRYLR